MALPFWDRHRGPYKLVVCRPHPRKAGFARSEVLSGEVQQGADAQEEALMLLADPRDTIEQVCIWSMTEECYVGTYRRIP